MKQAFSAGIIVYTEQLINMVPTRLYLLLYYPKGYWDFAKGHLEKGESPLDAAHRELEEETGLTAYLIDGYTLKISYEFSDGTDTKTFKTVTYYIGLANSQEVTLSHEHEDFAWLPYEEALNTLTYKNAQELLQASERILTKK